ncbi:MAG: GPW/gp25 family protein [Phaeodactylibacter sp.]|nr:GPW/gp25 family protein [Phaeodactylibacter sp.]MCB9301676.1 GPW/gp25 family protein [Lewinellaceae bacterium]
MKSKNSFLGTGWSFPPTFDKGARGPIMVSDVEDIYQSLTILLDTALGERVMQPGYGASLQDKVFEPLDPILLTVIKDLVDRAITYHEARIDLEKVTVSSERYQEGVLDIEIAFIVRATNSRFNFVYPFYIQEGSEIG